MAQVGLDLSLFQDWKPRDVVAYLKELRQDHSDVAICQSLLDAVTHKSLTPTVFSLFLPWSKSADTIALCIQYDGSCFVRKQGIKQFGKAMTDSSRWESAWSALGGTEGLVNLFSKMSVTELKALSNAMGNCNRGHHHVEARERAMEELLRALVPTYYSGSMFGSSDKRPVQHHYAQMVTACSPGFVSQLMDRKDHTNPLYRQLPLKRLMNTHEELLRNRVMDGIFANGNEEDHLYELLKTFVYELPPRVGPDPKISESMVFAMNVLQFRLKDINNEKRWPASVSEASIFFSLFRRSVKRRLSEDHLHDVVKLGLQLLEAKPALKLRFHSSELWSKLVTFWKRSRDSWEDLLTIALHLGMEGSKNTIGRRFLETSRALERQPELRWPMLRLYCYHIPQKEIDLDTTTDFGPLAKQPWSSDVFFHLPRAQAVRLLQGLYDANPEYSFLQGPGRSILSNQDMMSERNVNAALLLTMLQQDSEEALEKAETVVDELRKKAATSKEQSDRAQYAKAASLFAIASGCLQLYGETVTWQQRYVRDPLTLKVIFGHDAVGTREGIELVSGILEPLPDDMTLEEVATRVTKANKILITFHEAMLMAKREPSFYQGDWNGVSALFGDAINQRVARAKSLHQNLQGPEANVYAAIWEGTLAMLEKVSVPFLNQAYNPIRALFDTLPPTALATTTAALLEAGKERRKKADRHAGDDTLEHLSYEVLLKLEKSDKPELAQQLVLRTILDRPDASSWHRQLLSVGFMKCLSAKDAHELLLAFATAIGEKLEEQSYVKVGDLEPSNSAPPQSLVKVTTVKYLAQLLDNAEFISAEAAVDVLVELFKAGTHRDIRLATLDSLLSLLNNLCSGGDDGWRSNPLVEKIMSALETAIPVVCSINERRPPRLEDWEAASETGTLPEVSDIINGGLPPLLNALVTAADGRQYPGLKILQTEFVARFLLPILEESQAQHIRWTALLLAKYKVDLAIDDLPPTPVSPLLWEILLWNYPRLLPEAVFEDFNKHIVMSIAPPQALIDLNYSLRKAPKLRNAPAVKHWLFVFGRQYVASGTHTLVSMIHHDEPHPLIPNGISFGRLMEMVSSHASLFLQHYEKYAEVWNGFVRSLRPPTREIYPREDTVSLRSMALKWQTTGRLVLEKVISLVHETRARDARENRRSVLPSTSKLRFWLLPYPCFPKDNEEDRQCKTFADSAVELLDTLLRNEANVLRWLKIAEDAMNVSSMLNTDSERLRIASYIGNLQGPSGSSTDQMSSVLDLVRIALAMRLIEDSQGALKRDNRGKLSAAVEPFLLHLRQKVQEWQNSPEDGIREKVADWKRERMDIWSEPKPVGIATPQHSIIAEPSESSAQPRGLMGLPTELRQVIFAYVIAIPLADDDINETVTLYQDETVTNLQSTVAINRKIRQEMLHVIKQRLEAVNSWLESFAIADDSSTIDSIQTSMRQARYNVDREGQMLDKLKKNLSPE